MSFIQMSFNNNGAIIEKHDTKLPIAWYQNIEKTLHLNGFIKLQNSLSVLNQL
jgi:hypothetical protein